VVGVGSTSTLGKGSFNKERTLGNHSRTHSCMHARKRTYTGYIVCVVQQTEGEYIIFKRNILLIAYLFKYITHKNNG